MSITPSNLTAYWLLIKSRLLFRVEEKTSVIIIFVGESGIFILLKK